MEMEGAQSRPPGKSVVWRGAIPPRRFTRGLFFGGIGAALATTVLLSWLSVLFSNIALKLSAADWPVVPGVVTSSEITESSRRGIDYYYARIYYTYSVNGRNERSYLVAPFGQQTGAQITAQELCNRYPVGRPVTVYYNSKYTSQSMLEPGFDWSVIAQLIVNAPPAALLLSAIASWLVLVVRRLSGKAPGGLAVFSEPLPRLRTLRFPPILYGGLYGGGPVWFVMLNVGLCSGRLASPWAIIPGALVVIGVWLGVWRHYHLGNVRWRYDIIIDTEKRLLFLPGRRGRLWRTATPHRDGLVLSSEPQGYTRNYVVSLVPKPESDSSKPWSEKVYESTNLRDAREVAGWVSQHTGLLVVQRPDSK